MKSEVCLRKPGRKNGLGSGAGEKGLQKNQLAPGPVASVAGGRRSSSAGLGVLKDVLLSTDLHLPLI